MRRLMAVLVLVLVLVLVGSGSAMADDAVDAECAMERGKIEKLQAEPGDRSASIRFWKQKLAECRQEVRGKAPPADRAAGGPSATRGPDANVAPWRRADPQGDARIERVKANKKDPVAQRLVWSALQCEATAARVQFAPAPDGKKSAEAEVQGKRADENIAKAREALIKLKAKPLACDESMVARVVACIAAECDDTDAKEYTEAVDCTLLRKPWQLPPWRCR